MQDDPFSYQPEDEPDRPEHTVIGKCVHCGEDAHTRDSFGRHSCFPCAYDTAFWSDD